MKVTNTIHIPRDLDFHSTNIETDATSNSNENVSSTQFLEIQEHSVQQEKNIHRLVAHEINTAVSHSKDLYTAPEAFELRVETVNLDTQDIRIDHSQIVFEEPQISYRKHFV